MQTSYNLAPAIGRVGAIAESVEGMHAVSKVANVAIPFGCMTVRDTSDHLAKLPGTLADVLAACEGSGGVATATHAIITADGGSDPAVPTFPVGKEFAQMRKGAIFVLVEEAVTEGQQAFVRYATGIIDNTKTQLGAFRASPDGVAQVATLTPTAADTTKFGVDVYDEDGKLVANAQIDSGASATATTIVTALKAALGTIPNIAMTGTSTLILTSTVLGKAFKVQPTGAGVIAVAATTANSQSAGKAPGCYYKTSASAGQLAVLEVNLGGK